MSGTPRNTPEPEETLEQKVARLEAENAALKAAQPVKRMTEAQAALHKVLAENPGMRIDLACVEAGATATSHGLVFRAAQDGFLAIFAVVEGQPVLEAPAEPEAPEAA